MTNAPVVLVHGLGSSFEHGWRTGGWIDLLGDTGRRVVPIDLLGHGTAPHPHEPEAYAHLDEHLEAALPDEPIDAIGFSLGAQLLLRVAARAPERFAHLVAIGVGANVFRDDGRELLANAFEQGVTDDDIGGRVFVSLAAEAGNDPLALAALLRRESTPLTPDELAGAACPTLVIIGDKDFAGPPDPLVDALPNAKLVTLRKIDHFQATRDFGCIDAALDFIGASL